MREGCCSSTLIKKPSKHILLGETEVSHLFPRFEESFETANTPRARTGGFLEEDVL